MGLFRSIPLIERDLPFLFEINFTELARDLTRVRNFNACRSLPNVTPEAAAKGLEEIDGLCTKYPRIVGIQQLVDKLCLDLEPATSNGVFITGARESGKTTLIEALVRARAQGRLSSQLGTKPFYVFDATGFFTKARAGEDRLQQFIRALGIVADSNGLLIIDNIDDFVEMAGADATLLLNILVSVLETHRRRGMGAIILAEDTGVKAVNEAGKSLPRVFKTFPLTHEPSFDELKSILMASALVFEKVHNVKGTEEAIDEIIRLLSRYPGRAFTSARPGNAIHFMDMAFAYVSRIRFAEPQEVADLRTRLTCLQDEYAVVSSAGDAERTKNLTDELASVTKKYVQVEGAWRKKFAPLEQARQNFATIERELPMLRAIQPRSEKENLRLAQLKEMEDPTAEEKKEMALLAAKRSRTKEEETKFNIYAGNYDKAKAEVAKAEAALYADVPRVMAEHPRAVFNSQTGINIKSPAETRERLGKLDDYLASQIFLQDKARKALADAYRARERGVKDPSRPTVLLFGGGTGLGKSELVKALVRYHLGMEHRADLADQLTPVTISLSEFGDKSSVSKLTGASPGLVGYDDPIPWHEEIRKDPKSIVLFDEGDKAHPVVMLTLMQGFEEGLLRDGAGRPVNLKDTIIIININGITSADLDPALKDDPQHIVECVLKVQSEAGGNLFTDAVLNRIDGIYIFEPLGEPEMVKIMAKEMRKVNSDFRDHGVKAVMDEPTTKEIIHTFPNPSAGGRGPRKLLLARVRPKMLEYIDRRDAALPDEVEPRTLKDVLRVTLSDREIKLIEEPPTK